MTTPSENFRKALHPSISPDCMAGKHTACDGSAWFEDCERDVEFVVDCCCECHDE